MANWLRPSGIRWRRACAQGEWTTIPGVASRTNRGLVITISYLPCRKVHSCPRFPCGAKLATRLGTEHPNQRKGKDLTMKDTISIPGYTYGTNAMMRSPVTLADFELMKKSVLFGDEDVKYLRLSRDIVKDQVEAILDVWYGFVGSNPHLLASFTSKSDGKPLGDYLGAVRKRFGQWILDTAQAEYDQKWLDYQQQIGLRPPPPQ